MRGYDVEFDSPASVNTVYTAIADFHTYTEWQPFTSVELRTQGAEPGGPGTLWALRHGKNVTCVRVQETVPPRRLVYTTEGDRLWSGYRGVIELTPDSAGGTHIRWYADFTPRTPGTSVLWKWFMGRAMRQRIAALSEFSVGQEEGRGDA
ncbi:hypothetical protein SUDANB145_04390 [Streptomyces sp. enrichment culture]